MKHRVKSAQYVSRMCMVCGVENQSGLGARFFVLESGEVVGVFRPQTHHQGYPGRLHGGIISSILDETIGRTINAAGGPRQTWGVTAEIDVKFRKPVPIDGDVKVIARLTRDSSRVFEGTGQIVLDDGTVAAEAHGVYVKLPLENIASVEFEAREWFDDRRPVPDEVELGGDA